MILITGAAGFIGFHLIRHLKETGYREEIAAFDNYNDYYDPRLKEARAAVLKDKYGIAVRNVNIAVNGQLEQSMNPGIDTIVHLAAQAGVRYSIEQPKKYIDANIVGFTNILEWSRNNSIEHVIYASSSSVYGNDSPVPFSESDPLTTQESLYAVTKATNEMMAHVYSKLYGMTLTGLRFFTVYGSYGRPDMAYYSFAEAIGQDKPIQVYNNGKMERDFTHVSDIVEGIRRILVKDPADRPTGPSAVYNIGRGQPTRLLEFITTIENLMGKEARKDLAPMQPGDVLRTWADVSCLERDYGYRPITDLKDGLAEFISWYKGYHRAE